MRAPIRVRLAAWYAVLLAVAVLALSAFLVLQLRSDLRDAIDKEIHLGTIELTNSVVHDVDGNDSEPQDAIEDDRDFQATARAILSPSAAGAQLLDSRGNLLVHYGSVAGARPMASARLQEAAADGSAQTFTESLGHPGERYRVRVSGFQVRGQGRVLVLAESLQPVEDAVMRVLLLLLLAGPLAVLVTGLVAYRLAYRAVLPVERITVDAQDIAIDRLNERVAVPSAHDETRLLAVTLNAMLARIETGVIEKHRLLADAAHELRTPLAIMRNEIDVALAADELSPPARTVLASTRDEVDRMTRTTDNLLTSAQTDEGRLELLTVPVDLRRLTDDSIRALRPLADAKQVTLSAEGRGWTIQADPPRLQLVLTNLIDNAVKHSPAGETVRVQTWRREDEVGVTVTDHGPGIPPEDTENLFDRFYRAIDSPDTARAGSGLGLAISREVALAHGGRIWVDSPPGGGSAFSVALPGWRALPTDASANG